MDDTVKNILVDTVKSGPLSTGRGGAYVYALPGGYLLRTREKGQDLLEMLDVTTSLWPIALLPQKREYVNFGLPLLRGPDFEIVDRIPGINLDAMELRQKQQRMEHYLASHRSQPVSRDEARARRGGTKDVFDYLHSLPPESWESFLNFITTMTEQGLKLDVHWGNILADGMNLKPIDPQLGAKLGGIAQANNLTAIKRGLFHLYDSSVYNMDRRTVRYATQPGEYATQITRLMAMVDEVAEKLDFPQTREDVEKKIKEKNIQPAKLVTVNETLGELGMNEPSEHFQTALNAVKRYIPINKKPGSSDRGI